jgi:hypothetical protein
MHSQEAGTDYVEFSYSSFGGGMNFFPGAYDFELSASLIKSSIGNAKIDFESSLLRYVANYSTNTQKWNQNLFF